MVFLDAISIAGQNRSNKPQIIINLPMKRGFYFDSLSTSGTSLQRMAKGGGGSVDLTQVDSYQLVAAVGEMWLRYKMRRWREQYIDGGIRGWRWWERWYRVVT